MQAVFSSLLMMFLPPDNNFHCYPGFRCFTRSVLQAMKHPGPLSDVRSRRSEVGLEVKTSFLRPFSYSILRFRAHQHQFPVLPDYCASAADFALSRQNPCFFAMLFFLRKIRSATGFLQRIFMLCITRIRRSEVRGLRSD